MAFFSATADVAAVLMAGGLGVAERLTASGYSTSQIFQTLQHDFTPIGGQPFPSQVYQAIIARAQAALYSGFLLNRRGTNNPLLYDQHTGMVGLSTEYQYTAVVEFYNADEDRIFTRRFYVGSSVPLGKQDVLANARGQAAILIGDDTVPGAASAIDSEMTGKVKITDALVRI